MSDILSLFPETYEASRERFRNDLVLVQDRWPEARLSKHRIEGGEDLTIDWISSGVLGADQKVLIFTTAEHGIEGYVGSAMLQRFIETFLPRLDSRTTGLLLVHAINPWGMKHHRRVNPNNADLNRTFLYDRSFDRSSNPEYDRLLGLFRADRPFKNLALSTLDFYLKLAGKVLQMGRPAFKSAFLLGQYRHPRGLFYGGEGYQEETKVLIDLYRQALGTYDQVLHLDMHTGYGPRTQMSIVNSVHEVRSSREFMEKFRYPLVVAANPQEFYAIQGDMIDYEYDLWRHEHPEKVFYATSFEFGTYGDGFKGAVGMPRAMSFENRLYWAGAGDGRSAAKVKGDFEELFNPASPEWRAKAVRDADQAFEGILKAQGYIV